MTKQVHASKPVEVDPAYLFANGGMIEYAERTWRTWLRGADRVRAEAADMLNDGWGKGAAAMADIAHCTSVAEALDVQTRYASTAIADWLSGSRRLTELMGEVMRAEFDAPGETTGVRASGASRSRHAS
jgi:hypothetical protein